MCNRIHAVRDGESFILAVSVERIVKDESRKTCFDDESRFED